MRGLPFTLLCLAQLWACGASSPKAAPEPAPQTVPEPEPTEEPAQTAEPAPEPEPEPPSIPIPNGRMHDGYIVGGLPSKEHYDAAIELGIDSALSLMSNAEEGIREVAPYASSLGVRYIRFTVASPQDLTESMAWQFAASLGSVGKPAIIHSAGGERVGAMFALVAFFVDEQGLEESMRIGRAAGMGSLAEEVERVMSP